jgi:general secretion pathway protein N
MRQRTLLALVGGGVFMGVAIATLPASLLVSHLPPDITVDGVGGSVWSGDADLVRVRGVALGAASWSIEPLGLLSGRLQYHLDLTRSDGSLHGRIAATAGALLGEDLALDLPIGVLSGDGWQGEMKGTIRSIRLEQGWPVSLTGAFTFSNVQPPGAGVAIGSYAVEFDPATNADGRLVGRVRDVDSPLQVRAQLLIKRDRSYTLDGDVTPRPNAPPQVTQAIGFLGAPDASGRRPFMIGGTF